ncbi:hypothetical protein N7510_000009 [Penicillium lagena]|uniref:uncharacterized protein n=1 Tax=Penicillium lagena TaxID=94218 RepID=UPI002541FEF0|nr:uncharacterized protein N7510_000009 [Penicillium lagena]KAJ5623700.1 hypothetical protein N7510_000009 [Penicillium lagena]
MHTRSLIWQDTLVSLCYDRPPGITVLETVPFLPPAIPGDDHLYTFSDSCHYLFMTANKIVQALDYAKSSQQLLPPETILDYRRALNAIESRSVPHVQDISKCQSRDDCIQHYFFRTFSDSVMLCLCRPAVLALDGQRQDELTDIYLSRCRSVLQTYLELLKLQCPIRKSWLFVHITLSCALIFGMATKRQSNPRDEVFLIQFFNTLSQTSICTGVPAYQTAFDRLKKLLDGCE